MARSPLDPFGLTRIAMLQSRIGMDAAETILRRSTLMMQGALTPAEATAMWMEKPVAVATGMQDAALALARGGDASSVVEAALKPVASKTAQNARRLARR